MLDFLFYFANFSPTGDYCVKSKKYFMKTKLLNYAHYLLVVGVIFLLLSYPFTGITEKIVLWISLVAYLIYLFVFFRYKINSSISSKMLYMTFVFWVLSRLAMVYTGYSTIYIVFSAITAFTSVWVAVHCMLYITKCCTKDAEEHLDEDI